MVPGNRRTQVLGHQVDTHTRIRRAQLADGGQGGKPGANNRDS